MGNPKNTDDFGFDQLQVLSDNSLKRNAIEHYHQSLVRELKERNIKVDYMTINLFLEQYLKLLTHS